MEGSKSSSELATLLMKSCEKSPMSLARDVDVGAELDIIGDGDGAIF